MYSQRQDARVPERDGKSVTMAEPSHTSGRSSHRRSVAVRGRWPTPQPQAAKQEDPHPRHPASMLAVKLSNSRPEGPRSTRDHTIFGQEDQVFGGGHHKEAHDQRALGNERRSR
eukprot:gene30966-17140_t